MILSPKGLEQVYETIRREALAGGCSVLLLVAPDVDALAACRIITTALRADLVSFYIKPVAGYEDLVEANETLIRDNGELKSVLMINCGGGLDLSRCLALPDEAICYVIDSHRPYRLENAFDQNQILILDDGNTPESSLAEFREAFELARERGDERDEWDDDDDSDNDDGGDDDDDDDDDADAASEERRRKSLGGAMSPLVDRSRRRRQQRRARRKRRKVLKKRVHKLFSEPRHHREYYGSTSHGLPASFIAYELVSQLGKTSNELLWLSIVGLTDQYVHERIDEEKYEVLVELYGEEAQGFNDGGADGAEDSHAGGADTLVAGSGVAGMTDRIVQRDEFDLMLLRHWTLYDALYHSRYVATRLGVWRERGSEKIGNLLVTMGLPLEQCRESFATMRGDLKSNLAHRLDAHAVKPEFRLTRLRYKSFHRKLGFKQGVSAADVVYAVTALLEAPHDADAAAVASELADEASSESDEQSGENGGVAANGGAAAAAATAAAKRDSRRPKWHEDDDLAYRVANATWQRAFWRAYDALGRGASGEALLERGVWCAKRVQQAIVREGSVMLERKAVTSQGAFRYAFLTQSVDSKYFTRPLALMRLGRFLLDARDAQRKSKKARKGLVLLALDEVHDSYLVVGVAGNGGNMPTSFGKHFRRAAELAKAEVKWHGWEASVVQIARGQIERFEERLAQQINLEEEETRLVEETGAL